MKVSVHSGFHFRQGFSLVEVTLCIGLLAFTMIPLVALLGTGLQVEREARAQSAAGRILTLAASSLLSATMTDGGGHSAGAPFHDDLTWESNPGGTTIGPLYFDAEAHLISAPENARYALHVRIEGQAGSIHRATLVVTWPSTATVGWNNGRAEAENALGWQQSILHLPRKP